jgi:hypothetical protein
MYLSLIRDENEGCVTISETKPASDQLDSSELIESWEVIALDKNKRNTNIDHISNAKKFLYF